MLCSVINNFSNNIYNDFVFYFYCRLHAATKCIHADFVTMSRRHIQLIEKKSQNWYAFVVILVNLFRPLVKTAIANLVNTRVWNAIFSMMRTKINTTVMAVGYVELVAVTDSFTVPNATCVCQFNWKMGIRWEYITLQNIYKTNLLTI